jgi:hypothetical protein
VTEQPVVVAALAPPEPVVPAQDEINAFAAAANAEVSREGAAPINLANIRAPIPQLLAERIAEQKPDADAAAVELAALPVPSLIKARMRIDTSELPAEDLKMAAALADQAAAAPPSAASSVPPDTVATLPSGDVFIPLPIRRPGDRVSDRIPVLTPREIEMASLAPAQRGGRLAGLSSTFSGPRKGGRPTASVAAEQPQRTSIRTEPKLTDTIISKWALSQDRVKMMASTTGTPRKFVGAQLREAPKLVYANRFAPGGGDLPHNQFTGSAVNFINVARFGN